MSRVDYAFDGAFVILSSGTGFFDSGNMLLAGTNILRSNEGNGVIQFPGIHSQISSDRSAAEDFGGFQVGVAGIADVTPGGQEISRRFSGNA